VSALAFYEATKKTQAEIVSMDLSEKYLKYAEEAFRRHGAADRIITIQGPCLEMFVLSPLLISVYVPVRVNCSLSNQMTGFPH
jgi:hypothetical protein